MKKPIPYIKFPIEMDHRIQRLLAVDEEIVLGL